MREAGRASKRSPDPPVSVLELSLMEAENGARGYGTLLAGPELVPHVGPHVHV